VEIRRVLLPDEPTPEDRPVLVVDTERGVPLRFEMQGRTAFPPAENTDLQGVPYVLDENVAELPAFTVVARTEEQLNTRIPNFAEVLRQAQEQMARAGVPPQLFGSPSRGKRTRLTKCNKCNNVLGEADQEAGKCTTCGAFYNVPVPKAEDVEPIKVDEDEDGRAIRTCPNCGNFTTVDPTYGDLCYRCIRAANE
jgi:hypothetical protein